jgi:hypothetical protein
MWTSQVTRKIVRTSPSDDLVTGRDRGFNFRYFSSTKVLTRRDYRCPRGSCPTVFVFRPWLLSFIGLFAIERGFLSHSGKATAPAAHTVARHSSVCQEALAWASATQTCRLR